MQYERAPFRVSPTFDPLEMTDRRRIVIDMHGIAVAPKWEDVGEPLDFRPNDKQYFEFLLNYMGIDRLKIREWMMTERLAAAFRSQTPDPDPGATPEGPQQDPAAKG